MVSAEPELSFRSESSSAAARKLPLDLPGFLDDAELDSFTFGSPDASFIFFGTTLLNCSCVVRPERALSSLIGTAPAGCICAINNRHNNKDVKKASEGNPLAPNFSGVSTRKSFRINPNPSVCKLLSFASTLKYRHLRWEPLFSLEDS